MFKYNLKFAIRNIFKTKWYSLINLLGLSIGMSCVIMIMLWAIDELSFDKFHKNSDLIYRVTRTWYNDDGTPNMKLSKVSIVFAPMIKQEFPEVEKAARLYPDWNVISYGDKKLLEECFFYADQEVFDIFSFDILSGKKETLLDEPGKVVITEEIAKKYFGNENPIGKTLSFEWNNEVTYIEISGVIKSLPANSHFHADFICSYKTLENQLNEEQLNSWNNNNYATYLLFSQKPDEDNFNAKLRNTIAKHRGEEYAAKTELQLQKLTEIYLKSDLDTEIGINGNITYVIIFSVVALFILIIACSNYINLTTAKAEERVKEVGFKKVVGAGRISLTIQFLSESIIFSIAAYILAAVIVVSFLPLFNTFSGKHLSFISSDKIILQMLVFLGFILIGIISGFYPALLLSSYRPINLLKRNKLSGGNSFLIRKSLVIVQFTVSISLLICIGIIFKQLNFIETKNLGYNKENIIVVKSSPSLNNNFDVIKQELTKNTEIVNVSLSQRVPSTFLDWASYTIRKGNEMIPGNFAIYNISTDNNFIPTYNLKMMTGNNFSNKEYFSDNQEFILNACAAKKLGFKSLEDIIGTQINYFNRKGTVVGIIEDFHFESLHNEIKPLMLMPVTYRDKSQNKLVRNGNFISLKIITNNLEETIGSIKKTCKNFESNIPFSYEFLDKKVENKYYFETQVKKIFSFFIVIALIITCLGLLGLISFTTKRRMKEIGIRKVNGAKTPELMRMISKEFTSLVIIGFIISCPIAYYFMHSWLKNFAYKTSLNWWIFALAGLLALGIALLTVSWQSWRAATRNPVEALRYE
ncbi:MAG: ABC transporter permease [Candidatus Delongbacteria bacterium]|nr:ABC transporter permease [Candidatus Delongbacteria bacterium]